MRPGLERRLATGANAALVAIFVVVITALVVDLAARHRWRWDLSAEGAAGVLPQTESVLARLEAHPDRPMVTITAFSSQKRNTEAWFRDRSVRDLLRELSLRSPSVATHFVDFDADRLTAERLGVDRYGTVVVEALGDRVDLVDREIFKSRGKGADRELEFHGEAAVTRALEQLLDERGGVIYTLWGHGERRVFDRGIGELQQLGAVLGGAGWTVRVLDLLRTPVGVAPSVPEDAAAVLMLGPRAPLAPVEEEALRAYLARGGSLGVWVDPGGVVPGLLAEVGVTVPSGIALDPASVYPFEDRPLLRYPPHVITEELADADILTLVSRAAPIEIGPRDGARVSPLLTTSPRGWIERGTESPPVQDPAVDGAGPVTVAVAVEVGRPHPLVQRDAARILVVADADAVGDDLLAEGPGNATFVGNAVRWLARADDSMTRTGRPTRVRRLAMTAEQLGMIRWLVVGVLPLLTLLAGGAVWAARRGR